MQTAEAIVRAGGEALVVAGDVTAEDFPEKIVRATLEKFGCIDILINNAGAWAHALPPWAPCTTFLPVCKIDFAIPSADLREAEPHQTT